MSSPAPTPLPCDLVSWRKLEALLGRNRADLRRLASHAGRYYEPFDEWNEERSKWRHIDNPTGELRVLQKRIHERILRPRPFPETVLGGVRGVSVKKNAAYHARQPFVIALDLRDCFPRIHDRTVFRTFLGTLGCSAEIAAILAKLTTFQHRLPQGAPTSTLLSNLVLLPMHDEIQGLLRNKNAVCTFWIDDITVSGLDALDVLEPIIRVVQKHGHAIRRKKLRLMSKGCRQEVTGLVVNRGPSIPEEYRTGVASAIAVFRHRGQIPRRQVERLRSQVAYIRHVRPAQARRLADLLDRAMEGKPVESPSPKARSVRRACRHTGRHHADEREHRDFRRIIGPPGSGARPTGCTGSRLDDGGASP